MTDDWSHEETKDPLYADQRNFYKVEKWSRDGQHAAGAIIRSARERHPRDPVSNLNKNVRTGGDVKGPGHDGSLLRRAMLISIAERLKTECDPPTDLTPELRNILRRLEEEKDKEKDK